MTDITQQLATLAHGLKYAQINHRVIGQNLANVNTPHYKTREVNFEQLIARLDKANNSTSTYEVDETSGLMARKDGNNVDLDRELGMLRKNALAFQTLAQLLGAKAGIIQRSISG